MIFQEPGLHTDTSNPRNPATLTHFKWIVQQTQNGSNPVKPFNLSAYKQAGFKVGPWGVNYHDSEMRADMTALRNSAPGADLLVMNVERQFDPGVMIEQGRFFSGPKALICLVGDLVGMGQKGYIQQLLNAGWDIIGETYTNDNPNLTPAEAEWQALNAGIPKNRFSHALGMYYGENGWVTGAQYANLLAQTGAGRRFSAWMVEHGAESSYTELRAQATAPNPGTPPPPVPPPPDVYTASEAHADVRKAVDRWLAEVGSSVATNRLPVIKRVSLSFGQDAKWNAIKTQIDELLKSQGL